MTENSHTVNIISSKYEENSITYKNVIKDAVLSTLIFEKVDLSCCINIKISNDEEICEFNQKYRSIDNATDVLSFPMQEFSGAGWENISNPEPDMETGEIPLGDIILSLEKVKKQALEYNNTQEYETAYLLIHSTLHLLGYNHDNEENEKIMHLKSKQIIQETGLDVNDK